MAIETTLTSVILNPWATSSTPYTSGDQLVISYADLGYIASASDSYKSTAGDVFKVYVDGVRIYRTSDSIYAGGKNFLEDGDVDNSKLAGISATWASTSDTVWTIDTANQKVTLDTGEITGSTLYGSSGKNVSFTSGETIIELRRSVQDQSAPSIDFSNASILTEQDLDNSSANVFHMAQQAVETADNALPYDVGTGVYQAYQPGTTTNKKITQVADGTATNDAVNYGQLSATETTTLAYKEDAEDYKLEAKDWADKENGQVKAYTDNVAGGSDLGHSAKAHASVVGTHAPSTGSAKEWAQTVDVAIDTTFSAKEYAQGDGNSDALSTGGSAKGWAQDTAKVNGATTNDRSAKAWAQGASMTGATLGGSAKDWAQLAEDSQVNGSEYSAKHYSAKSSASATAAAASEVAARNSANSVTNILDNFGDKYLGTMSSSDTASTATITGAKWVKGGSQITNVTQASGTIEIGQVLTNDGSATGWPTTATVRIIDYNSGTSTITINQVFTEAQTSGETLTGTGYGVYGAYDTNKEGPAKDNDNGNLIDGALYFDTTNSVNSMRVYDLGNTKWVKATSSGTVSINEFKFTATAGQTTFTGSADSGGTLAYSTSNLIVTLNGVVMENGADYTANNGTSIVLSSGAAVNDELNVIAFKSFETSDMVSASSGGTFNANVSFGDNNITNVGDISLDTISSDAGTSIGVTLGTDAGDDFNVGSGKLLVEGDTGLVSIGTGGDFETSTTGKIKQKGSFMQSSTHQAWVLGG